MFCEVRGEFMDHEAAIRQKMTERYLLDELDSELRDQFEDHYFECQECALDVKAGALFVDKSKAVLAEDRASAEKTRRSTAWDSPGWLSWLRPAFTVPVMAMLLAEIGYQSLVVFPQMRQALARPQVFQSWASVNIGTWGDGGPTITIAPRQSFLLFVRIPPDATYASYVADLYNPAGKPEWSLKIPATANQNPWPVEVPGAERASGAYKLAVRGVTAAGETKEIGGATFELQIKQ
jgi:Putative zinc-finger